MKALAALCGLVLAIAPAAALAASNDFDKGLVVGRATIVTVAGSAGVGNVLTCTAASPFSPSGYVWTRDGATITGATGQTYTQATADQAHVIRCAPAGSITSANGVAVPSGGGGGGSPSLDFSQSNDSQYLL